MQPDRLAVALRPRSGWEALDLGFRMARDWWKTIWPVWLSVYAPVAALCLSAMSNKFHAILLLWWLKPVFDRAVLHTVSRAVFGEPQGVRATWRALPQWLLPGLLDSLLFSRLSMARSFALPVTQLERQRGKAARKRHAALGSRMRNYGVWLTLACIHFEAAALFGLSMLASLLDPAVDLPDDRPGGPSTGFWDLVDQMGIMDGIYYAAAVSIVEPFYVTAGFALYLNRRAILEGWDIELALRRLDERLRATMTAVAALLLVAAFACLPLLPRDALAEQASAKSAAVEIKSVLATPEFATQKDVEGWHYIGDEAKPARPALDFAFWRRLSELFGRFAEAALWILAIVLLGIALYYVRRALPDLRRVPPARYRPPEALFGFDLAPESLPADVAAAADALRREGREREALSLLYRGALSALVHRHGLELGPADTEGDCARAVNAALPASAGYFSGLVAAWQSVAYAARAPAAGDVERLCREWAPHFAGGPAP